jgi:integrase
VPRHRDESRLRIFQYAVDEGALDANPVRKVAVPKRRADPDKVFGQAKRRALTPEEAGQLLACFPLFWWDHVLTLLGTGLRFGELAGLRRRRVRLDRTPVGRVLGDRASTASATSSNPGSGQEVRYP